MRCNQEYPQTSSRAQPSPIQSSWYGYATLSPFQLRLYLLKRLLHIFYR